MATLDVKHGSAEKRAVSFEMTCRSWRALSGSMNVPRGVSMRFPEKIEVRNLGRHQRARLATQRPPAEYVGQPSYELSRA
jgi:hypothetical protein